jgi:DNA-binding transcriptional LysR family regulator
MKLAVSATTSATGALIMELRHLRYFVAVAEDEHITRAAARLGIQQPPLSQQIQNLERELGVTLFARRPRKISLNAAGKVFLSDARRILAAADDAMQRVRQFDKGNEGTLMIGFTSSASMHPQTMQVIDTFRTMFPLVSLQIEEAANHDLLHLLEEERLDIAFVRSEVTRYPTLKSKCLSHETMVVAIPAKHRLAKDAGAEIDLETLRDEDMVFYRQANGSGIGDVLLSACERLGFRPRIVSETQRIISTINMVAAGFGVAVVPKSMESFKVQSVVYRDLSRKNSFTVPLNVAFRQQADAETLRRFLLACDKVAAADAEELAG